MRRATAKDENQMEYSINSRIITNTMNRTHGDGTRNLRPPRVHVVSAFLRLIAATQHHFQPSTTQCNVCMALERIPFSHKQLWNVIFLYFLFYEFSSTRRLHTKTTTTTASHTHRFGIAITRVLSLPQLMNEPHVALIFPLSHSLFHALSVTRSHLLLYLFNPIKVNVRI